LQALLAGFHGKRYSLSMSTMKSIRERVKSVVREASGGVTDIRHQLHSRPELLYREHTTSSLIRDLLDDERLTVLPPFIGTDTVCILEGSEPGPSVLLRADIDALPIADESGTPWQSVHKGIHHACGHDGHASMLLGAAFVLSDMQDILRGRVIFVFQPAEEGGAGGKRLLEEGLFDSTGVPDAAFALHGWPGLAEGVIQSRPGPMMAAQDRFYIDVAGTGGHGAMPHLARDPVTTSAALIMELQSIISREYDPRNPAVLSICTVHGGTAENIIPDTVSLSGTTRYFDTSGGDFFEERMRDITERVCRAHRTEGSLRYERGYIPLVNDPGIIEICAGIVTDYLGSTAWRGAGDAYLTAEDFAYFLDAVPGAMLLLGLGENWPGLHTPEFDFNDGVLEAGITALVGLALSSFPAVSG